MSDNPNSRYEMFAVRFTTEEMALFDQIAEHYGMNRSELVRWLVVTQGEILGFPIPKRLQNEAST